MYEYKTSTSTKLAPTSHEFDQSADLIWRYTSHIRFELIYKRSKTSLFVSTFGFLSKPFNVQVRFAVLCCCERPTHEQTALSPVHTHTPICQPTRRSDKSERLIKSIPTHLSAADFFVVSQSQRRSLGKDQLGPIQSAVSQC